MVSKGDREMTKLYCTDSAPPYTRAQSLANAFERVASADHYMIGITDEQITIDELDEAEQILINSQNNLAKNRKIAHERLNLALDLLQFMRDSKF
jgi:hypothetical protein